MAAEFEVFQSSKEKGKIWEAVFYHFILSVFSKCSDQSYPAGSNFEFMMAVF